jgi:nicotinamide-nucleotide amidase
VRAEILAIGSELMDPLRVETNALHITGRLFEAGVEVGVRSVVADDRALLESAFRAALARADIVVATGGLGPTEDDLTREAIAAAFGETPAVDPELEATLRRFFEGRGYAMPESNVKQAWLIPSARAIPNPRGTAPGWWVERDGKVIVAMPGPPTEMTRMWEKEVEPELRKRGPGTVLVTRTLKTAGIGEGTLNDMVREVLRGSNPSVGIYARADGVHLRIAAKAREEREAWSLVHPVEEDIRRRVGPAIWGADDDTFESIVGDMLKERHLTLATMESCTGGLLASIITDVSGSSAYFKSGLVAYQTEQKIAWGVDAAVIEEHGVISAETAREMARAARSMLEASVGVGITGIAGSEEQEGKPPGTIHIAVDAMWEAPRSVSYTYAQGRDAVKRRAVTQAIVLLRQSLLDYRGEGLA